MATSQRGGYLTLMARPNRDGGAPGLRCHAGHRGESGRQEAWGEASDHRGHCEPRGRDQGRGVICAQRAARRVGGHEERILAIAEEIGFQPNSAARALSDGRAGAFGLSSTGPPARWGWSPSSCSSSRVSRPSSAGHTSLLFTVAEDQDAEIAMYRSWWAQRRVDGVFLVDLQVDDRRVAILEELRMPAVVIGPPAHAGSFPAVWQDDAAATRAVVEFLAAAGHRRIARVTGITRLWHTKIRSDAFTAVAQAAGVEARSPRPTTPRRTGPPLPDGCCCPASRPPRSCTTTT